MSRPRLEGQVLAELLAIRKSRDGVTVAALARSPVVCALLGEGDPNVAYTSLMHRVLDSELDLSVQAAAASLGLASDRPTHLGRLDDFGAEVHLDQRQVRRYSDKGLRALARLITTSWPTTTVPSLDAAVIRSGSTIFTLYITTRRLHVVEMRPLVLTLRTDDVAEDLSYVASETSDGRWLTQRPDEPLTVQAAGQTSLVVVWRGELWPKFSVTWTGNFDDGPITSETLGNKLVLRLSGQ